MKSFVIVFCLFAVALAVPSNPLIGGRVSDGLNALPGVAPYACSVRWGVTNRSHSCGASLLTAEWFISAAHCFGMGAGSMDIQCGVTNRLADVGTQQVRTWTENNVVYHPGWTGSIYSDDVVIIRVSEAFNLNALVQPIRLRAAGILDSGEEGRIFGWGSRDGNSNGAQDNLQTAAMDLIGADVCRERLTTIAGSAMGAFVTDNDICAARGTYAVCAGDSGSPLMRQYNGVDTLVGMAVWGLSPCGRTDGAPSVFSRISAYTTWIEEQVGQTLS